MSASVASGRKRGHRAGRPKIKKEWKEEMSTFSEGEQVTDKNKTGQRDTRTMDPVSFLSF